MCVVLCLIVFGCQYQCNWLPGKTRLRNDLLCVEWDVKPYTLSHSKTGWIVAVEAAQNAAVTISWWTLYKLCNRSSLCVGVRDKADSKAEDHLTVCRALVSSVYRPPEGDRGPTVSQQQMEKLRASLLRRYGITEFTRLHGAVRGLLMTSYGGDVARQRRLDSILASSDVTAVYFPLFFQLVQLEMILGAWLTCCCWCFLARSFVFNFLSFLRFCAWAGVVWLLASQHLIHQIG